MTAASVLAPRRTRQVREPTIVGAILLSVLLVAGCSSGSRASRSASPSAPVPGATASQSGGGASSLPGCPAASVVNAALGQNDTGPVVSGTAQFEICTYKGTGSISAKVSISVGTPTEFKAGQQNVGANIKVAAVSGLGDEAYGIVGGGGLWVLKGNLQIEVTAPFTTAAQDEALARQILAGAGR